MTIPFDQEDGARDFSFGDLLLEIIIDVGQSIGREARLPLLDRAPNLSESDGYTECERNYGKR
jgi:hypothetical protein